MLGARLDPVNIAISRAIGDLKAQEYGLINEPHVHHYPIDTSKHIRLAVASDGVWDEMCKSVTL